jgi:hypothetical protein
LGTVKAHTSHVQIFDKYLRVDFFFLFNTSAIIETIKWQTLPKKFPVFPPVLSVSGRPDFKTFLHVFSTAQKSFMQVKFASKRYSFFITNICHKTAKYGCGFVVFAYKSDIEVLL